jgi:hypothetical protein
VTSKKTPRSSKKTSRPATRASKAANSQSAVEETTATMERRARRERRKETDRRHHDEPVAVERRKLERRAKVNRRRQIDPTTCERDYTCEEIEFMNALDDYKRTSGRMFPTCSEILEVFKKLGYEKPSVPGETPVAVGGPMEGEVSLMTSVVDMPQPIAV